MKAQVIVVTKYRNTKKEENSTIKIHWMKLAHILYSSCIKSKKHNF